MNEDNYTNTESYNDEFQNVLIKLIARICMDHPYHGLIQLIALSNGHNVAGRQASAYLNNVGDSKVEASSHLLDTMKKDDPDYLSHLIQSYTTVIDAYISLAVAPTKHYADRRMTKNIPIRELVKGNKSQSQGQPLDSCLRRSSTLKPCVLTKVPTIRPGADYGDGLTCPVGSEFIASFESNCSLTETGIHRPKIVMCIGSAGGRFKQLVKGEGTFHYNIHVSISY
jgi:ataxia telangiectasia mutated family protein